MLYPAELRAQEAVKSAIECYVQKTTIANLERERKLDCDGWFRNRSGEHGDGFNDVQTCAAKKLVNDRLVEAAGVVLDPHGSGGFIQRHVAYSVDLANLCHGESSGLCWGHTVTIQDIKLCHVSIIPASFSATYLQGMPGRFAVAISLNKMYLSG